MDNKVALITCYFGRLPNYFPLWLNSCINNSEFTWIVVTDDAFGYDYPKNVKKEEMTFGEFKDLIKSKLSMDIHICDTYKVCDFKPLYGCIFDELLKDYRYWGHCDTDIIWGNLSTFITTDLLRQYDRLFVCGHLSVYKNNDKVNHYYELPYTGLNYKTILCDKNHFGFDEMRGMNAIFKENNISWYQEDLSADINFYNYDLRVNSYPNFHKQYFLYDNGKLYQVNGNGEITQEYPYIHLQKRKMNYEISTLEPSKFYIMPDCFGNDRIDSSNFLKKIKFRLNAEFKAFKIKMKWNFAWRLRLLNIKKG